MKNIINKYLPLILLGMFCAFTVTALGFQQSKDTLNKDNNVKEKRKVVVDDSSIKEELHRYLGYEELLPKYLSAPYDISMNSNVQGSFIDISYLLLLLLPILFFLRMRNIVLRFVVATCLLFFYIISAFTGFTSFKKIPIEAFSKTFTADLLANTFASSPIIYTKLSILNLINVLYQPFNKVFNAVSGEGDYITYPLLLILFMFGAYLIKQRLNVNNKIDTAIVFLFYAYGFFWLLLGVGVIWYGILLLPLGLILMIIGYARKNHNRSKHRWLSASFVLISSFWVLIGFTTRMASYNPIDEMNSKGAVSGVTLMYGLGKINTKKAVDLLYPNFSTVLAKVNQKPYANVYRAGTFFHYFIEDNHERVIVDNQLPAFESYTRWFPDKKELTAAFKRSGYKYLLIDLNLATIDNTPDQSLTKKNNQLWDFLNANPEIQLIGTDRVVLNNEGKSVYSIYGKSVQRRGTFAAFEIK